MVSIDDFQAMLERAASEIPKPVFQGLNGGIALSPAFKLHRASRPERPLYIKGEYRASRAQGRSIMIYYGSFERVCGHLSPEALREEIAKTLRHELTHHLEGMAGERGLEAEDARGISEYEANLARTARRD